jgi:two-component system sensor histidine kinase YesM
MQGNVFFKIGEQTMKGSLKSAIELIKKYSWKSVFIQNLKRFLLIIMIPFIIINGFITFYYTKTISKEANVSATQDFTVAQNTLKNIFYETERLYYTFVSNNDVNYFLSMPDMNKTTAQAANRIQAVYSLMSNYCHISDFVDTIYIYNKYNSYVVSSQGGNAISAFAEQTWYNKNSDDFCFVVPNKDNSSFFVCYNIYTTAYNRGLIVFQINPSQLSNMFVNVSTRDYAITLFDTEKQLLYTTKEDQQANNDPDFAVNENDVSLINSGNHINVTTNYNNIFMNLKITNSKLASGSLGTWFVILTGFFIALLISLLLSFYVSISSYQSIETIIMNLNKLNEIDDSHITLSNELAYINKNIHNMHNKNVYLEKALITKVNELKKLQSVALQMQFTPHFLFNTLNTLSMVVMNIAGVKNPASKIIALLSDLLTGALNTNEYIISIEQEIIYCRKYIEIESIKNENNFDAIWDIEPQILQYKTVKLLIQPIIENAFKHGIKYLRNNSRGYIKISGVEKNNCIVFEIINNGSEIRKEKLEELKRKLKNEKLPEVAHIGLSNVNRRIKLIFGDEYGITSITSEKETGTKVTITIPKLNS